MSFEVITPTTIMTGTDFYKWLLDNRTNGQKYVTFKDAIVAYTGQTKPFKGRTDGQAYKYTYNCFNLNMYKLKQELKRDAV